MNISAGAIAENQALTYLQDRGLTLRARNFRGPQGEIDLILNDGQTLVFVEVRQRKNAYFGSAAESVTPRKQHKIIKTAHFYTQQQNCHHQQQRFDVVAITGDDFDWIQNAF